MEVIYQFSQEHVAQLHKLYQREWWSKARSLEDTANCVAGSQICIGILDSQARLIGFVRVLTDYTFKALIFDVIVEASQRGRGIGSKLIELVKTHEKLREVMHFELYGLPDVYRFYKEHGFSTEVGGAVLMRRCNR